MASLLDVVIAEVERRLDGPAAASDWADYGAAVAGIPDDECRSRPRDACYLAALLGGVGQADLAELLLDRTRGEAGPGSEPWLRVEHWRGLMSEWRGDLLDAADVLERALTKANPDCQDQCRGIEVDLAEIYVRAGMVDTDVADHAVAALEQRAQWLAATLGAGSQPALSMRGVLAAAEARCALSSDARHRVERALEVLVQVSRALIAVAGPANPRTVAALAARAEAEFAVAQLTRVPDRIRACSELLGDAWGLAIKVFGASHPITSLLADLLGEIRRLQVERSLYAELVLVPLGPVTAAHPPGDTVFEIVDYEHTLLVSVA